MVGSGVGALTDCYQLNVHCFYWWLFVGGYWFCLYWLYPLVCTVCCTCVYALVVFVYVCVYWLALYAVVRTVCTDQYWLVLAVCTLVLFMFVGWNWFCLYWLYYCIAIGSYVCTCVSVLVCSMHSCVYVLSNTRCFVYVEQLVLVGHVFVILCGQFPRNILNFGDCRYLRGPTAGLYKGKFSSSAGDQVQDKGVN